MLGGAGLRQREREREIYIYILKGCPQQPAAFCSLAQVSSRIDFSWVDRKIPAVYLKFSFPLTIQQVPSHKICAMWECSRIQHGHPRVQVILSRKGREARQSKDQTSKTVMMRIASSRFTKRLVIGSTQTKSLSSISRRAKRRRLKRELLRDSSRGKMDRDDEECWKGKRIVVRRMTSRRSTSPSTVATHEDCHVP